MRAHRNTEASFQEASVQYTLTYRDVVDILRLLKEADHCESVELSAGDLKLKFRRAPGPREGQPHGAATAQAPAPDPEETRPRTAPATRPTAVENAITAPMLGMFYRASEPGAAPFVEVGSQVSKGDTVGLIEVMKWCRTLQAVSSTSSRTMDRWSNMGRLWSASSRTPPETDRTTPRSLRAQCASAPPAKD